MNNDKLKEQILAQKAEAVAILDGFFKIPEGFSSGETNRLVDCIVSAAMLEVTSVMLEAKKKADPTPS